MKTNNITEKVNLTVSKNIDIQENKFLSFSKSASNKAHGKNKNMVYGFDSLKKYDIDYRGNEKLSFSDLTKQRLGI